MASRFCFRERGFHVLVLMEGGMLGGRGIKSVTRVPEEALWGLVA